MTARPTLADRTPSPVADEHWTPAPLPIDLLLRHDAILCAAARLAHAGIRVVLPPVAGRRS